MIFDESKLLAGIAHFPTNSLIRTHLIQCVEFLKMYCRQRVSLRGMVSMISRDNEPYAQQHHLGAYSARCFETISDYVAHELLDEKEQKSVFSKFSNGSDLPGCSCTGSSRAELDHLTWQFKSTCPCAASNRSCTSHCHCHEGSGSGSGSGANDTSSLPTPANCSCHNQLNDFSSLQLGRDLQMVDSWGIDCYSRTLIQMVMTEVLRMKNEEVEMFLQKALLPAVSHIPEQYASDMRYGVNDCSCSCS